VNQIFCGWSIWTLERFLAVFSWALQGRKNYFYLSLFVFLLDGVEHLGLRYFLLSLVIILGRNNWVSFFLFNCLLLIETWNNKKCRVTWNLDCEICRIFPTRFYNDVHVRLILGR
jgi:hypothetical protein